MKQRIFLNLVLVSSLAMSMIFAQLPGRAYAQEPAPGMPEAVWNVTFDGGTTDQAFSVATDTDGNVYVAGNSGEEGARDYRTIKYDRNGVVLWNVTYDEGGGSEYVLKVAVDLDGNVYVSGTSTLNASDHMLLVKYNSAGVVQWTADYDSGSLDQVTGAVTDELGNVYVAGVRYTGGPDSDRYLLKYDSAGTLVWAVTDVRYGRDRQGDIAIDGTGNLYVTGFIDDAYRTTKYDNNGAVLWDQIYDPGVFDYSFAIAVDNSGNVYVAGHSGDNYTYLEVVTLKYDSQGNLLWDRRYDGGQFARPAGIAVDNSGNIYLAVSRTNSAMGSFLSMDVIKYDGAGNLVWELPYNDAAGAQSGGVAIDADGGNIYLTGYTSNGANDDFRTIKYSLSTSASLVVTSASTDIYPGDPVPVNLNIQNANELYAAQALCETNPDVIRPQEAVFGEFFDPTDRLIGINNADAASGTWTGAISQRSPALPLSGNGLFATVTYVAHAAGTTSLSCEPLFADQNGFAQPVSFTGADVTVLPFAVASGTAQYQGRMDHAGITITASGPVTVTAITDSEGNYVLDLRTGIYIVAASADGYLRDVIDTLDVVSGDTAALPGVTLRGGDANGNNTVDIGDATLVAANFGLSVPPADVRADVNGDGIVNVQDLAILGSNYGLPGE